MDLGTSSIKAVLCKSDGKIIAKESAETTIIKPSTCEAEIDPEQYFLEFTGLVKSLVSQISDPKEIKAICLSGATGNTILLDHANKPLARAISWLDTRTLIEGEDPWTDLDRKQLYQKNGWPYFGTFPLAHLGWLEKKKPELWKEARRFAMLHDFIFEKLCGLWIIDHSKATTFYLQDQVQRKWNLELLSTLGIKKSQLPQLCESGKACGSLTPEICELTGLSTTTMPVTGSFDHPSAARGTGVWEEGDLLISAGTSWVVFTPVENREIALKENMLIDPFLSTNGCWGAIFALTAVGEKLHKLLAKAFPSKSNEAMYEHFNSLAMEAEPGAGGTIVNLLDHTEEANWKIAQSCTPQQLCRALMEGIVFQIAQRVEQVNLLTGRSSGKLIFTGGPTKSAIWTSILADVLNRPVSIPKDGEYAGAMGAVILGGMGCGIYSDERDGFNQLKHPFTTTQPDPACSDAYIEIQRHFHEETAMVSQ